MNRKDHWETVYKNKPLESCSWFQPLPETTMDFLDHFNVPLSAHIIDIGGGDSLLVDHLLDQGYRHVTVLDISEKALERAKNRLGDRAKRVRWIVADAGTMTLKDHYDVWQRSGHISLSDRSSRDRPLYYDGK